MSNVSTFAANRPSNHLGTNSSTIYIWNIASWNLKNFSHFASSPALLWSVITNCISFDLSTNQLKATKGGKNIDNYSDYSFKICLERNNCEFWVSRPDFGPVCRNLRNIVAFELVLCPKKLIPTQGTLL